MAEDRVVERVYCNDRPNYGNNEALTIAAMSAAQRNNDCGGMWPMMAMMGGGMG